MESERVRDEVREGVHGEQVSERRREGKARIWRNKEERGKTAGERAKGHVRKECETGGEEVSDKWEKGRVREWANAHLFYIIPNILKDDRKLTQRIRHNFFFYADKLNSRVSIFIIKEPLTRLIIISTARSLIVVFLESRQHHTRDQYCTHAEI